MRPSPFETLLLCVYPVTLFIGTLFGVIDPSSRNSVYNPLTQSHPPETAPSYFAKKNNFFNVFFVKQGWAWITISYFFFLFTHPSTGPCSSIYASPKRLRGLLRYTLVTFWWIFVTQWFFGPPIIDRGFTITGGQCHITKVTSSHLHDVTKSSALSTAISCKAVGGQWKGGHDISGHVFLLVLGSLFLLQEVLYVSVSRRREERLILMQDGTVKSAETDPVAEFSKKPTGIWTLGSKFAMGMTAMNLYMLFMTAAYFHTWFEKLTGLLVAFAGIFVVYFLPRAVPGLRNILSMPGL